MTVDDPKVPVERAFVRSVAVAIVLGVLLIAVTIALVIAVRAINQSQAECQFNKTAAESPVPKTVSDLGLRLVAGSRVAYEQANCDLGKLKPADPRVAALIKAGIH